MHTKKNLPKRKKIEKIWKKRNKNERERKKYKKMKEEDDDWNLEYIMA